LSLLSPANPDIVHPLQLEPLTLSQWDDFLEHCPGALLFHTSAWLKLLAWIYQIEWQPLGVWLQGHLIGLFPLLTRKLGPFRLAGSPLMQAIASTPFMGPLIETAYLPSFIAVLISYSRRWKFDHVEISLPILLPEAPVASESGFSTETCRALVVPLERRTTDQIWQGLTNACRRAVRKAERGGVMIEDARDIGFLDEYYRMCQQVYRGSGRLPHLSKEFYAMAWDILARQGRIKALLAVHADQIIAGGIFLLFRRTAYYLSGASYDDTLHLRPNNLIQWKFIEWAASNGYQAYDMGGAVVPDITHFKLSFGAQFAPYSRLYRANTALAKLGRAAYSRLIPLWRRLSATRVALKAAR
jgi:CelD/BcsL family acetyltransferase involved in cellulose biosynthesis